MKLRGFVGDRKCRVGKDSGPELRNRCVLRASAMRNPSLLSPANKSTIKPIARLIRVLCQGPDTRLGG